MKLRNKILAGVTAVFITTSGIALKINANTENIYYKYLPNSYEEKITDVTYIDTDLQRFVCNLCKNDDVITPALIYSIAWRESFYTSDLKKICEDNSIDYGMMQINEKDFEWLQNKCNIFLELINWLNDNKLSIIPEKTLFSAYLGISVDYYNDLLNNASDIKIRNLLKSIDEYFTTNQFGALISDDRKSLERIQKTKTYGQEMLQTQPDVLNVNTTNVLSLSDIKKQIESKKKNIIDYKVEE